MNPDSGSPPLADKVALGLGDEIVAVRSETQLLEPKGWVVEVREFRGGEGPWDLLSFLAEMPMSIVPGPIQYCVGPGRPIPDGLEEYQHFALTPADVEACTDWYNLGLFFDGDHVVAAVLELWEA